MLSHLIDNSRRNHHVNALFNDSIADGPLVSDDSLDSFVAPLMDLKSKKNKELLFSWAEIHMEHLRNEIMQLIET